jgi:DNA-directed RNA polymerase specialized sigma24 family protein
VTRPRGLVVGRLDELHRERYREFVRVATAIVGTETDGIDIVQESFEEACTQLHSSNGTYFSSCGPAR